MVDICIITHLSKPTECTTPRVNPNANSGLCAISICQCRFTDYKKCTTLMGDVNNAGSYACMRAEDIWDISVLFFRFCSEPKTALKTQS